MDDGKIDRLIVQDEVKLYRTRVVLAYLDGPVFDFTGTAVIAGEDPVPVFGDGGQKAIGMATLDVEQARGTTRLVANIAIDYASEERLLAETKTKEIYPRFFGGLAFTPMPLFDFQKPLAPLKLRVDGIVLSRERPHDAQIPALGEPVL